MKTENNFNCGEMLKYTQSAFLKIAAQAFLRLEIFLKFSLGFDVFEAHFLIRNFLIRKRVFKKRFCQDQ